MPKRLLLLATFAFIMATAASAQQAPTTQQQAQPQQQEPTQRGVQTPRRDVDDDCDDSDITGWRDASDECDDDSEMTGRDDGSGWRRHRDWGRGDRGFGVMRPGWMMGRGRMQSGMMMRMLFALMDSDGDGTVSLQEFQAAHERIFKAMDANKDGVLTLDEIRAFIRGSRTPTPQR